MPRQIIIVSREERTPLLLQQQQLRQQEQEHQQHQTANEYKQRGGGNNAKSEALGLSLLVLSALSFSSMSLLVSLSGRAFPSFEILLARSTGQAGLGFIGCIWLGINPFGRRGVRKWLLVRGIFASIGVTLFLYSITQLPLADATVIFFINPTFTAILSVLLLGEPFGWFEGICSALCMLGAALVAKPEFLFGTQDNKGLPPENTITSGRMFIVFCAFIGAIMAALAYITVRKIGKGTHFFVNTVYVGLLSSLLAIPSLPFFQQEFIWPQGWYEYTILCMTGVTAFMGQCLLNKGLQLVAAGPGTLMRTNDVIFAFLFGKLAGATIIVTMTTAIGLRKWYHAKSSSGGLIK
ncbi:hypothetical protein BDA99DRAFT_559285 [Phascolomyces articulosus]|uniref:EamA domain-containing protein n=1 Tax=Phascolomyces articulosus TaxID=60185 RepID=A0AAD5KBI8_9FUNG|nr:hypothetical protein BDA99DRAFT_559285 [Phascolomyces articulosus]